MVVRLVATTVLLLLSAGVSAQSLGEAAKRAQEKRKTTDSKALVFDERDLDPWLAEQELLNYALDGERWKRFLAADARVAAAIEKEPAAVARLEALKATSVRALERFIRRDPVFGDAVKAADGDPGEYAYTQMAVSLALAANEAATSADMLEELTPAVKANVLFLRSRTQEVKGLRTAGKLPLRIAPPFAAPTTTVNAVDSGSPGAATAPAAAPSGPEVPDFEFKDFNGSPRRLSDFRGRYVLLDFWGSWCGPCRQEIPYMRDAYDRFRSRGLEIIGMDYEQGATVEEVRAYLVQNAVSWTFARPDTVRDVIVNTFQVRSFPTLMLLDPDGRVLETRSSMLRGQRLAATLDRVLPK